MNRKCEKCQCETFDVPMIATDFIRYSAIIDIEGGIDTESTIKEMCGETTYDYSQPIYCYHCGHELPWSDADPTGYADYQVQKNPAVDDPDYPSEDWRAEVAAGDTMLGYYAWVINQRKLQ